MNYIDKFLSSVSNMSPSQEASLKLAGVVAGVALLGMATFKTLNYFFPDDHRTVTKKIDGVKKTLERNITKENKIFIHLQEIEDSPFTIRSTTKVFENTSQTQVAGNYLK